MSGSDKGITNNIFKRAERSQKPSNTVVRPHERTCRPLPTSPTTQPPPSLPAPARGHSPAPSRLPASSPQVPHDPVQPSGPHGSHPMPGSRRSSATSAQKGEGAADSSALLCITDETAAIQAETRHSHVPDGATVLPFYTLAILSKLERLLYVPFCDRIRA